MATGQFPFISFVDTFLHEAFARLAFDRHAVDLLSAATSLRHSSSFLSLAMDLSHLLCHNAPPEPSEIPLIQASFVDLLLEKQRLELLLGAIEEQVEQHAAVLSPIRKVPLEILSEIFIWPVFGTSSDYLSSLPPSRTTMYPDSMNRVVLLGLVCRDWRCATVITPSFWSKITVDRECLGRAWPRISYDRVATWFSHQNVLPRILEFGQSQYSPWCCGGISGDCRYRSLSLGRLLAQGPVLDKLVLRLDSLQCFQRLFDSFPPPFKPTVEGGIAESCPWQSFRQLKHLVLHFKKWMPDRSSRRSHTIFFHLPPVTKFELYLPLMEDVFEGDSEGWEECDEAELNIPRAFLEGLKQFTFSCNWTLRQTTGPLVHCINLETLVLNFKNHCTEPVVPGTLLVGRLFKQGIRLPKLQTLHVKHCKWKEEIEHLKFIRAPSLENLLLDLDSNGSSCIGENSGSFWWFPFMKDVNLRTLRLSYVDFNTDGLAAMNIHEIPSLVHLTLTDIRWMDEIFESAGPFTSKLTQNGGRPFPSLQVLELLDLDDDFDFGLVFNFVKNRRPHHVSIVDGREKLVFVGPPDTLTSVIVMYWELDADLAEKGDFYGKARMLEDAGIAVRIGGPLKLPSDSE
ncbi:hypothetical protein NMY22_g14694 [Coprinellus aureogranulatus]|nr:hypothetical protein NMY22_g14694 [Coprinellus aureogranulatus]